MIDGLDRKIVGLATGPARWLQLGLLITGTAITSVGIVVRLRGGGGSILVPMGVVTVLAGTLLFFGPVQTWLTRHSRVLSILIVWLAIFIAGAIPAELYARSILGYLLWSYPLQKGNFWYRDVLKIWNSTKYEQEKASFQEWPFPIETFKSDSPYPQYLFKPGLRMALVGNRLVPAKPGEPVYWSSNSWGFRGPEFPFVKSPGVIRIVCLGASTTEGMQGDQETYPYYLQQELARLYPRRQIEVINAGHHAMNIDDLLAILRERVLPLQPDIIIFYEAANVHYEPLFKPVGLPCAGKSCWLLNYPQWYQWAYGRSALFVLLSNQLGWNNLKPPPMPHTFDDPSTDPSLNHHIDGLRQIVQETKEKGITIVVSSFVNLTYDGFDVSYQDNPWIFDNTYKFWYPILPAENARIFQYMNQQFSQLAQEAGVPFFDAASLFPKDIRYFDSDYIHFTPEGNRLFAGFFARYLIDRVLPPLDKGAGAGG